MKNRIIYFCSLIFLTLFISACSQESNKKSSLAYHNTTARYNAYFLANERIGLIEEKIIADRKDDYNLILPIFHFVDSGFGTGNRADLDYVIEKATYPIKLHKNSKWVDDSYILIGKARRYGSEMDFATQTFKYVNTTSKEPDTRHLALMHLIQCHLKTGELNLANKVKTFLDGEEVGEKYALMYHLTLAEFDRMHGDFLSMKDHVDAAIPVFKGKKNEKARLLFIAGQLHQLFGEDKIAYENYSKVLKKNPPYELEFHTKINMAKVSLAASNASVKKIYKYFDKFLKDEKNEEYKDLLYYEKGLFEYRRGKTEAALELLNQSVHVDGARPLQQAYAYRKMGDIYYDHEKMPKLKKYTNSKLYYDSTVAKMTSDISNHEETLIRSEVLTRFVKELEIVELEDSLQKLAKMDSATLSAFLDNVALQEEQKLKEEAERQKRLEEEAKKKSKQQTTFNTNGNTLAGSNFIFYNGLALSQSNIKFKEKWGDRVLEDNWRRSKKSSEIKDDEEDYYDENTDIVSETDSVITDSVLSDSAIAESFKVDKNKYYKDIPFTDEAIAESNIKIETALFKLGKILKFELDEPEFAIEAFTKLNTEYPENKDYVETLYFLYVLCSETKLCDPEVYKNELLTKFQYSIFAKIVENPNYLEDYSDENKASAIAYEEAYNYYQKGYYVKSNKLIQQAIQKYPKSEQMDKMFFLQVLTLARMENFSGYIAGLKDFQKTFPTSPLVDYATELLVQEQSITTLGSQRENMKYEIKSSDSTFFFVGIFYKEKVKENEAKDNIFEFNKNRYRDNDYHVRKIDFTEETFIVVVKEFDSYKNGQEYLEKMIHYDEFTTNYTKEQQYNYYIISADNFNVLLNKKDIPTFESFYKNNY